MQSLRMNDETLVDYDTRFFRPAQFSRLKLVVEVSHGLGNRLRSLLSAAAIALQTDRDLIVIWPRDIHLDSPLDSLFHLDGIEWYEESFLDCAHRSPEYIVYDYLKNPKDENKREKVDARSFKNIYVHTAYLVHSNLKKPADELKNVIESLKPKPEVADFMSRMKHKLWVNRGVSIRAAVGIHIRMQADLSKDVPGVLDLPRSNSKSATARMRAVARARNKCHWSSFATILDRRLRTHSCEHTYAVSADVPEAVERLRELVGNGVVSLRLSEHERCDGDRSRVGECVQLALAELLLLSKTKAFVFSSASSFSEVAHMIGNFDQESAQSGCAA